MLKENGPLYFIVKNSIKNDILSNKLSTGDRILPENKLVEEFNVSRTTISKALSELADEGWISRTPGRGTFVNEVPEDFSLEQQIPEPFASEEPQVKYSEKRRKVIGMLVPDIAGAFLNNLILGAEYILNQNNCTLYIRICRNKESEEAAIRDFREMGADGLIIFPVNNEIYNEEILKMKVQDVPFVLIDRFLPGVETNYVVADNVLGGRLAAECLVRKGHSNIVVCAQEDPPLQTYSTMARIKGYKQVLLENNIAFHENFIIDNFLEERNDQKKLQQLITEENVTAVIALNVNVTLRLQELFTKWKIRIPEDVSVVSFDDPTSLYREDSFFTYIDQHEYHMGNCAAEILLERLKSEKTETVIEKNLPVSLVEKKSVRERHAAL